MANGSSTIGRLSKKTIYVSIYRRREETMVGEHSPLSIIPSECFRWRPRVQFIESFRTKASAIDYAFKNGYNLIVERNENRTAVFDVLLDIDETCTEGLSLELNQTEEVLIEPDSQGGTGLMLMTLLGICRRFAFAVARQRCWTDMHRAFRSVWNRHIYWGIRSFRKRLDAATSFSFSMISPRYRHLADQRRWTSVAITLRQRLNNSSSALAGFARQFSAEVVVLCRQEVVPFIRRSASRFWWSSFAVAFRRWWHRNSQTSASDLAKRFAASVDSLYTREIAPRLRQVIVQYRQGDLRSLLHRVWRSSLLTFSGLAKRFAAAAVVFRSEERRVGKEC